jgi:predicted nucleotidyltransferase
MTKSDVLNYLSKHYQEFHNKYNVEKIGLFGSYARDEATEDSDIDIFVQMHPKLLDMIAIKQLIEEDLHLKVDIVRLRDKMNPYLKKRILRDGIYAV